MFPSVPWSGFLFPWSLLLLLCKQQSGLALPPSWYSMAANFFIVPISAREFVFYRFLLESPKISPGLSVHFWGKGSSSKKEVFAALPAGFDCGKHGLIFHIIRVFSFLADGTIDTASATNDNTAKSISTDRADFAFVPINLQIGCIPVILSLGFPIFFW